MAGGTAVDQPEARFAQEAFAVGAAVGDARGHAGECFALHAKPPLPRHDARESAHAYVPPSEAPRNPLWMCSLSESALYSVFD